MMRKCLSVVFWVRVSETSRDCTALSEEVVSEHAFSMAVLNFGLGTDHQC